MFKLLKRRQRQVEPSLLELSSEGYCRVVGESHYQEALRATASSCSLSEDGRRTFTAALKHEPNNPYDANAVGVWSSAGKVGHLARDDAVVYRDVLDSVARKGYDGLACRAHLTGGEPDKPSLGIVLRLADPESCLAELEGEDLADEGGAGPGYVGGRHYTGWVDEVKRLRRGGRDEDAERLLLELVEATEAEAAAEGFGVAPWYYEQLAITYRKRGNLDGEIAILERFERQHHAPGTMPPRLLERLEKARALVGTRRGVEPES